MMEFYIEEINVSTICINDFYRLSKETYEKILLIDNYKQKVLDSLEIDKEFTDMQEGQFKEITKRYMTQILLYELQVGKHVCVMTMEEISKLINTISENDKFNSLSAYLSFVRSIHLATKWAYNKMWRGDYYLASDILSSIDMHEIISENNVYTIQEIREIAYLVDSIDVQITILAITEGIKTSELIQFKRSQFDSIENNKEIKLSEDRYIKMSDELYLLCYKFAHMTNFEYKYRDNEKVTMLEDSEYLIRGSILGRNRTTDNRNNKLTNLANRCSRALKEIGVKSSTSYFRTCAMTYDILKGMSIEEVNKKYGTKYAHKRILVKDREIESRMIEKILGEE